MEGSSSSDEPPVRGAFRVRFRAFGLLPIESNAVATTNIVANTAISPPSQIKPLRAAEKVRETVSDSPTMISV